jgi:hypothetical protein
LVLLEAEGRKAFDQLVDRERRDVERALVRSQELGRRTKGERDEQQCGDS